MTEAINHTYQVFRNDVYAQLRLCVLAVLIGKFRSEMVKFQTHEMEKFDDAMLLEFHWSGTLQYSTISAVVLLALFVSGKFQLFT
jgi:hypothetical protein